MDNTKEVDVFRKYEKFNKLKVVGIAVLIFVVGFTVMYFFCKSLFKYSVNYELNGGVVYELDNDGQFTKLEKLNTNKLNFLMKIEEPKNVKKEGFYIERWSSNENLSDKFKFGTRIWTHTNLYVKWEEGVAVRLHFAQGEENSDMTTAELKGYYEQYVKSGTKYTLPKIFNLLKSSEHYGEQLLWFADETCSGEPFDEMTYTLTDNIDIYGKWFDTQESKFKVDENGILQDYLGYCNKIILPSSINKIKDIPVDKFTTDNSDTIGDQEGTYHSVWRNVMPDHNGNNGLEVIYLNRELRDIGDCAFKDCVSLEYIIFKGDNVETIGLNAFENCSKLGSFNFPSKVTIVESNTFLNAFNKNKNVRLYLKNVIRIESSAFINSNIYSIEMDKVEFIGKNAFSACHSLTDFKIYNQTEVVTSDVPVGTTPNPSGIFYDTYTTAVGFNTLKIYVPTSLRTSYLALYYWNAYADAFVIET